MERFRNIITVLCLAMLLPASVVSARSASVLLQEGLYAEQIKGDLDAAIKVYQRVLGDFPNSREQAAQALLHIGLCYEKLGKQEAQKAYERLIKDYADQAEPVRIARKKLEQLDAGTLGTPVKGPTYRLVLDEKIAGVPTGRSSALSPSGDRIVFVSQNKLYITNQAGAVTQPLLDDLGPWESIHWPYWSPDGNLVAYRLSRAAANDSEGDKVLSAVFVIDPDGGTPRKISPDVKGRIQGGGFWTPDSRHLSYWASDGLHTVSLEGKEVRFIPAEDLPDVRPWFCVYSPNGRWLVSSRGKRKEPGELCIFPAGGGAIRRIADLSRANQPIWAPDGRTLYFILPQEDYGQNIWKIPVDPETALATGEPQQVTFFEDAVVFRPQVLGDGSRIGFNMSKRVTSIQVADASVPQEARSLVHSGKYSPELSPDGKTVYYIKDRPGEEGIYAVSREGGTSRRLTETLPAKGYPYAPLDLSPDGETLAFFAELDNEYGLHTLSVNGGKTGLLVKITNEEFNDTVPQWSPDGSSLAYATTKALNIIDGGGGKPRKLFALEGYLEGSSVRWSPDGEYIASLGASDPDANDAVFVVPASGGEPRQLTPVSHWLQRLEWHPDGKRLTYHISQYASETRQAYLDGRPPTMLLDAPGVWDYEGAWAPDGRRFFFLADEGSEPEGLYVYDEASGKTTFVGDCDGVAEEGVPSWSRDGKTMAWCATKRTGVQTWIMEDFQPDSQ